MKNPKPLRIGSSRRSHVNQTLKLGGNWVLENRSQMPPLEMAGSEDSLRASWTPWPHLTIRLGVTDCATNMACSVKRSTRKANRKSPKIGSRY